MRKLSLALLLLTLLGFVVFLGGKLPYFLFYVVALSILLPLLHSLITIIRLKGKIVLPEKSLYRGDDVDIHYQVSNNTPFLIPYLIIDSKIQASLSSYESKVATGLPGHELYRSHETVNLRKRGYFQVGEIEVIIQDIFKLFKFKKKISSDISLLVYPKTIKLASFRTSTSHHQGELISTDGRFEDRTRVNTFRDYVEGDSIKSMHWKLSAKRDEPIVKIFDNRVDSNLTIFLDNSSSSYRDDVDNRLEDKAVDIALSIIDYSLDNNLNVSLVHQKKDEILSTSGSEIYDLKPFLEELARLRATGGLNIKDLILNNIENIGKGSSIIIITPLLNKACGAIVLELLSKNYRPYLIVVRDSENKTGYIDEDIRKKLIRENIPLHLINYHTNIKEVLEDYRE